MKMVKDRDLFSVKGSKYKRGKISKKKKKEPKGVKSKPKEEEESDEKDIFAIKHVPVSYQNIRVGQIILGSVFRVFKYHIGICLPNKMKGYLPVMQLSKSYNDLLKEIAEGKTPSNTVHRLGSLYSFGHLIVTKVISVSSDEDGKQKIMLSALPEDVNCELTASVLSEHCIVQCAVASEEENGYVMETGIRNIRSAFLAKKYAPEMSFGVGSVLLCAVKKTFADVENSGEIGINLSAQPSYINKEIKFSNEKINMASIFPGALVSGTISKVTSEGLELSFRDFRGFVEKGNLTSFVQKVHDFKNGENVFARVLYINEITSEIVCSMNARLCSESALTSELSSLAIDGIYSGNVVESLPEGTYFALPEDNYGFCHKRDLKKYLKETKSGKFLPSASYKCRVTYFHSIDQMYVVVLESEKHDSEAVLHVGERVSVKIIRHNPSEFLALIDKIGKICHIPKLHLADSNMSHPEKELLIGDVFNGRILKYYPGKDPVVTLKTELVASELPVITEHSENHIGTITLGYITKIYKKKLLVKFFNDCKASVFATDIPSHLRNDLMANFQVGSVVKCKIRLCGRTKRIMYASLVADSANDENVTDDNITGDKKVKSKRKKNLLLRYVVNCKIISVNKEDIHVAISGFNEKGCIPLYHFSDDVAASKSVFRLLNEGDEIKNAVVYAKSESDVILSVKPSIYHYVKKLKIFQLKRRKVFPSVVKECFEDEILVSLMAREDKSELIIPKRCFIGKDISILNMGMEEGQTLFLSKKMLKKSLIYSHLEKVLSNRRTSGLQVLYDTLLQETMIKKLCSEIKSLKLNDVVIGAFYDGKTISIDRAGTLVRISELGLDGVIHHSQYNDSCPPKLNKPLKVRVLSVNYYALCLELTVREDVKEFFCKKEHNLKVKQEAKCDILLAKKKYIIGRLLSVCPGQIIYLPSRRHINDFKGRHSYYETDKQYDIVIEHVDEELVLANLKVHTEEEFLGVSKKIPSITFSSSYPRNFIDDLMLDETHYTQQDFNMRALAKINELGTWYEKKENVENLNKWEILKKDKFSQLDSDLYSKNVKESRKLNKDLAKKRKFNESFDENVTKKDDGRANRKSKRRGPTLRSDTKKMKLDLIYQDLAMKENNEQEIENVTEENSDSEEMSEDDSHDLNNDKTNFLKVENGGFDWSGQIIETRKEDAESSSDEEIEDTKEQKSVKKLSKYEKSLKEKTEEKRTRELELERLDDEREPQTALDFEEKIEQNPHSSAVWIEYISFHLENTETEKAKAVASRALRTIPPTKEEERLALWNVSLRLEVMYGTSESVQNSFRDALSRNDELKIYNIMIDIFLNANKLKEADELIKKMVKKHSQNREVWIKAFAYSFKVNELTNARIMLDRSLLSLPKSDHVDVISRFAQLELKQGDPERGKTIFETLLSNFPKRLDIWNVYADLLLKQNDIEGSRTVLERITGLKLKMKLMRNAFKKLLEFEKKYGTPNRIEAVKAKVEEYVTAALAEEK